MPQITTLINPSILSTNLGEVCGSLLDSHRRSGFLAKPHRVQLGPVLALQHFARELPGGVEQRPHPSGAARAKRQGIATRWAQMGRVEQN